MPLKKAHSRSERPSRDAYCTGRHVVHKPTHWSWDPTPQRTTSSQRHPKSSQQALINMSDDPFGLCCSIALVACLEVYAGICLDFASYSACLGGLLVHTPDQRSRGARPQRTSLHRDDVQVYYLWAEKKGKNTGG